MFQWCQTANPRESYREKLHCKWACLTSPTPVRILLKVREMPSIPFAHTALPRSVSSAPCQRSVPSVTRRYVVRAAFVADENDKRKVTSRG